MPGTDRAGRARGVAGGGTTWGPGSAQKAAVGRRGLTFGGQYRAAARIRGRGDETPIRPGLKVIDGIDDASAELSIGRTGSVGAVLLERAFRKAEEARRLLRSQVACR